MLMFVAGTACEGPQKKNDSFHDLESFVMLSDHVGVNMDHRMSPTMAQEAGEPESLAPTNWVWKY